MSFPRHRRSFDPMAHDRWGRGTASRWSGPAQLLAATEGPRPDCIVFDESHRLFLGRLLSSRAYLRFAGCLQSAMNGWGRSRKFHRTATSWLTDCLALGFHFTLPLRD